MKALGRHPRLAALGLGLGASLVALVALASGWLEPVEALAVDRMMRLRGPVPADPRVVVCDIDAASLDAHGRWPWPRSTMAELVERLDDAGARTIALDMVFAEPSRAPFAGEDRALAAALREAGNAVLGYYFRSREVEPAPAGRGNTAGSGIEAGSPENISSSAVEVVYARPGGYRIPERVAVEPNLDLFAAAAASQGFFDHEPREGVLRHYGLLALYRERLYPALALRAVQRFLGEGPLELVPEAGRLPVLSVGGRRVVMDERGALWIGYAGPAGSVPTVSAAAVLAGRAEGLDGKLVLVGASEAGVGDLVTSPFGGLTAGVEVHAQVAGNLLSGRYLHDTGNQRASSLFALLALGPLVALLVVAVPRHRLGVALAALCLLAWPAASYSGFALGSRHLHTTGPALAGILALLAALPFRLGFVEREARQVRRTFQRYVSETVVEEMLRHPERVRLGGERREMTVLFLDIRGFTALAERLDSAAAVDLLNRFFTPMTRLVKEHGGTLDKYMGDALMAFFGAPLPRPDHAALACRTALAMVEALPSINAELGADLAIGVGLNSGEMAVGNMGSEEVLSYTVIGDAVNLGSRIEGLNKVYGTAVLASETTVEASWLDLPELRVREVDRVRVKGREEPVAICELLGLGSPPAGETARDERFADALTLYRARRFEEAEEVFEEILGKSPEDGPSRLFAGRCRAFRESPPPEGWGGVEVLRTK